MAFLLKVFSGSERLKARQKSADLVNETFQAELSDVQTKVEVENYELQMLVEMVYDSSYPESQRFLKQPSKDRLYAHKETISSLLFGLAAQGVTVAPLILTHFQKHGCHGIADTLLALLDLVRPLLDSREVPLFTSDDILDAIDVQWHSSVRSSPAFASLRGSTTASPLQSPRVSFSNPSPGHGFSNLSPGEEILSSPVSPFRTHANRLTQDFSFSPPSECVRAAAHEAPRRSLSFQGPGSEVNKRLQPLVEHKDEIDTGKDGEAVAPVHSSSSNVDSGEFGKGLSIHIPRSATSFKVEEFNGDRTQVADDEVFHGKVNKSVRDVDAEVVCDGFSESEAVPSSRDLSEHEVSETDVVVSSFPTATQPHVEDSEQTVLEEELHSCDHDSHEETFRDFSTNAPVHSSGVDVEAGECGKGLSINIPRCATSVDVEEFNGDQAQVADEEPRLEFRHEQFNQGVGDGDAEVLFEGFSEGILESEAVPSSRDSCNHEVSGKDITPIKDRVGDSDQTSVGMSQVADEEPRLEFPHERFDKSVEDSDAGVMYEGVSGGHADILESELAVLSSCEVSEKGIVASPPAKSQIHVEDSEQGFGDGQNVGRTQLEFSHEQFDKGAHEVVSQEDTAAEDILEESDQVPSCDLSNHEEVVALPIKNQRHFEDSEPTVIPDVNVEELNSTDISLISKAGLEEDVPISRDAVTTQLKSEVREGFQESEGSLSEPSNSRAASLQGESSLSAQGTEAGSSSWSESSTPTQGDSKDNIQYEMDKVVDEISTEAVETVEKDAAMEFVEEVKGIIEAGAKEGAEEERFMEGVEEDGEIMEEGGSKKSGGEDVFMGEDGAKEGVTEGAIMEGVKEDGEVLEEGGLLKREEEDVTMEGVEDKGYIAGVGEAEFRDQEPAFDPRSCITQSRTDIVSQSSFSDHYDGDETTTSSSNEGTSSSSDDEEAMLVKKKNHQFSPQIPPEHVGNPELQLYGAAALHSASYNLVTFDLTKLLFSTDENHQDVQGGVVMDESSSCAREYPSSEAYVSEQKVTLAPALEEGDDFSHSYADVVESGSTSLQNADIPMKQESNDAELFEGEFHQRNDSAALSPGDKLRVSRGDNEVTNSGGNLSLCEDEEALIIMDSAKTGSEDSSKSENLHLGLDGGEVMISTKSEDPGNDLKERDSLVLSSTIDEQDRISLLSDQVEGDSPELESQSKENPGEEDVSGVEKEKDLVVHVDEGISPCQGEEEEVEGQEIKQVLEGVNYQASSVQENGPSTLDVHVDESSSRPFEDLDGKEKDLVVMSPTQGDIKQVLNREESSEENTNDLHVDEVMKGEVVSKLSECGFKDLEMKDMSTQADDETKKMSLAVESGEGRTGISPVERDEKIQMENPQSLDKEKDVEVVTGSATYGVFLQNTKFLDSQGDFVRALTAPVILARHGDTEPERHNIRDSLISTPASNFGRGRRYNFLPTWCYLCCSKPSVL